MEINYSNNTCIFTPLCPVMDNRASLRLFKEINLESMPSGIDLSFVQECNIDFINNLIEFAKGKKIGIFNIPSEIFVLFNLMGIDKHVELFVSQQDFETNQRQLVNRKLVLI